MKGLRDSLVDWVDDRMARMLATPRAWGSDEAVEMQVLLLLQLRALALRPELQAEASSSLVDAYIAYLAKTYPDKPRRPLYQIVEPDRLGMNLAAELRKIVDVFVKNTLAENPFQHNELAIRLVFDAGQTPAASTVTGYYEEFRRAARAVARPGDKAVGRAQKPIEAATDFALSDVRVTPRNGAPAEALLLLGPARGAANTQRDYLVEMQAREAVTNLVAMGEWASSSDAVDRVPVDNVEQRNRVALQALRVLPRRGLSRVEIGGQLIGRSRPVEFRPEHERRLVEVIGAMAPSEPFDKVDVIRAIDLDRGLVVLKSRLQCYIRPPELLGEVATVGVPARVRGTLFRPFSGRAFVLADAVEPQDASEPLDAREPERS